MKLENGMVLSSGFTLFVKVSILGMPVGVAMFFLGPGDGWFESFHRAPLLFQGAQLGMLIVTAGAYLLFALFIKKVTFHEDRLAITDYIRSIDVPLGQMERVRELHLGATRVVLIELSEKSAFGKTVGFLLYDFSSSLDPSPLPVTKCLQDLVQREGDRGSS